MEKLSVFRVGLRVRIAVVGLGLLLWTACGNGGGSAGGATGTVGSAAGSGAGEPSSTNAPMAMLSYVALQAYPHDTTSYTEGLLFHNHELYESTGHWSALPSTRSLFGVVDLATGKIQPRAELDKNQYFGEGISFLGNKVYQLTYTTDIGFVYDAKTFQRLGTFRLPGKEGWGMTTDGTSLILSDGSSTLWYLDPSSFGTQRTLRVTENGALVERLNELEFIKGYLYANVYTKNYLVKIDPSTGRVVARIDLSSLAADARNKYPGSLEMNGIAWDSVTGTVYVTGKMWPSLYAIRFAF